MPCAKPPPESRSNLPSPCPHPSFLFPSLPQHCCSGQVSSHPTSTAAWPLAGFRYSWLCTRLVFLSSAIFCFRSLMSIFRDPWPLPWTTLGFVCLLRSSCRSLLLLRCHWLGPWTLSRLSPLPRVAVWVPLGFGLLLTLLALPRRLQPRL